jgi:hypothetical protein
MTVGQPVGTANGTAVRVVVRMVVAKVAPAELPLIDGLAAFDDAAVLLRLKRRRRRRDPLGFGLNEIETLVTLVVWKSVDQIIHRIATAAADESAKGMKALLRRIFRRKRPAATVPALTEAQRDQVRELTRTVAVERGLEPERAEEIADAVAETLIPTDTTHKPTEPGTNSSPAG